MFRVFLPLAPSRLPGLACALALGAAALLPSCHEEPGAKSSGAGWRSEASRDTLPPGFEAFISAYNADFRSLAARSFKAHQELAATQPESRNSPEFIKASAKFHRGDFFQFKSPADIPSDLVWQDGSSNPEIGDPAAQKGGSLRVWMFDSFPDTFRPFGPNSNTMFRAKLYDEIELGAVRLHPVTQNIIPAVARQWAVSPDGCTVFFRLDPDARYSDNTPVKAIDFLVALYVRLSPNVIDPFFKDFVAENFTGVTLYDDATWSVSLPAPRPLSPYLASWTPSPPHFYSEYGPDFASRYQWRPQPTTGAYALDPESLQMGRQITLKRVTNWWARDKPFTRYAYNPDFITYTFLNDESKALELFRAGEFDLMVLNRPDLWYEKSEIPEVHNGYIQRTTFFNIYPVSPLGIYLNLAKPPFDNPDVRTGLAHACNMRRVISSLFRGDATRIHSCSAGFGQFTNPNIQAREYSPQIARQFFARAGYTQTLPDGILAKPDGTRLSAELSISSGSQVFNSAMNILREDAKKCGFDLQLDVLDSAVNYRKVMEKRHQATLWGWGATPPFPSDHQSFHSSFAFDSNGKPKTNTNNINSVADSELDKWACLQRDATSVEELREASWNLQRRVHDLDLWIPGYYYPFTRIGYWRWVRWPDSPTTRFSHPAIWEPSESYLFWIDQDIKEQTLQARRAGKSFPESELSIHPVTTDNPPAPSSPPSDQAIAPTP